VKAKRNKERLIIHPVPMMVVTLAATCFAYTTHGIFGIGITESLSWAFLGVIAGTWWHWIERSSND
jgi:hypothetical protein